MKNSEIGTTGENIACNYLIKSNYLILERNFRKKFGEIDIIAKSADKRLIFIEVKSILLKEKYVLNPEDNFTTQKSRKVNRICQFFASEHPELIDEERGWQIDLITVEISQNGKYKLRHHENV